LFHTGKALWSMYHLSMTTFRLRNRFVCSSHQCIVTNLSGSDHPSNLTSTITHFRFLGHSVTNSFRNITHTFKNNFFFVCVYSSFCVQFLYSSSEIVFYCVIWMSFIHHITFYATKIVFILEHLCIMEMNCVCHHYIHATTKLLSILLRYERVEQIMIRWTCELKGRWGRNLAKKLGLRPVSSWS
jgi:hypothetical protein